MNYGERLGICAAVSLAAHFLLARSTSHLPARVEPAGPMVMRVEVREPPPQPTPAQPEIAPAPRQPVHQRPVRRAHRSEAPASKPASPTHTPTERPAPKASPSATPVFGISMESTSSAGTGPGMAVGNTLQTKPGGAGEEEARRRGVKPLLAPVPIYEVTKMPLPKGECTGRYTEAAREAGLEGVVVLTFVVDERGRVRDIKVLQGLGAGLTEAAKHAVQACSFSPGERDGKPVPTRIPSFKIRFSLRESE